MVQEVGLCISFMIVAGTSYVIPQPQLHELRCLSTMVPTDDVNLHHRHITLMKPPTAPVSLSHIGNDSLPATCGQNKWKQMGFMIFPDPRYDMVLLGL